jgi:hypothetical protein
VEYRLDFTDLCGKLGWVNMNVQDFDGKRLIMHFDSDKCASKFLIIDVCTKRHTTLSSELPSSTSLRFAGASTIVARSILDGMMHFCKFSIDEPNVLHPINTVESNNIQPDTLFTPVRVDGTGSESTYLEFWNGYSPIGHSPPLYDRELEYDLPKWVLASKKEITLMAEWLLSHHTVPAFPIELWGVVSAYI